MIGRREALRSDRKTSHRFGAATLGALGLMLALISGVALSAERGISVRGTTFIKDGMPWIPKGFTMVAFVAPEHVLSPAYKNARASYGEGILDQARSLGADVLRFQVSQVGLDPQSQVFDPNYRQQVIDAVRLARSKGFSVIVSMQWEPPSGLKGQPQMPSDITRRAWGHLVDAFANDRYVMLELFNEPGMWESTASAWPTWKSGMQSLVDEVRNKGAQNTLLLDGLRGAHYLQGAPGISDRMHRIAYAVHPYIDDKDHGLSDWVRDFGRFAKDHPVMVTEWNATSTLQCRPEVPQISRAFVGYLKEQRIGLVLWALDLHGTLFDKQDQPIGFKDFACGKQGYGAANVALEYFRSIPSG